MDGELSNCVIGTPREVFLLAVKMKSSYIPGFSAIFILMMGLLQQSNFTD